jgi:hypothetical protein
MQAGHGPKARAAVMAGSRFGARCPGQPRISDTVRVPRMPAMRTMAGMARTRARRDEQPPDQDQLVLRGILGDTGLDRADLRRAAVLNHELYGFYGISVWVTSAGHPRELLESTKLIKFERYAEFTVADLTGRGLALRGHRAAPALRCRLRRE